MSTTAHVGLVAAALDDRLRASFCSSCSMGKNQHHLRRLQVNGETPSAHPAASPHFLHLQVRFSVNAPICDCPEHGITQAWSWVLLASQIAERPRASFLTPVRKRQLTSASSCRSSVTSTLSCSSSNWRWVVDNSVVSSARQASSHGSRSGPGGGVG